MSICILLRKCAGVIGVVDVPYVVLEPTHNKQDFADAREYRFLLRAMGEYMEQYWRDMNLAGRSGGVLQFWREYGYDSNNWHMPPSQDKTTLTRRLMSVQITLQCSQCLKWRVIPFQQSFVNRQFPDGWVCPDNPDTSLSDCSIPEKKVTFPEGKLDRPLSIEDLDKQREQTQKKIQKEKEKLKKLEEQTSKAERTSPRKASARNRERSSSSSQSPPPSKERRSAAASPPDKPKTKAELRKQMEQEKEKEREREKERKRQMEELRKKKTAEEEKKKKKAEEERRKKKVEEERRKKREQQARNARAKPDSADETSSTSGQEEEEKVPPTASKAQQSARKSFSNVTPGVSRRRSAPEPVHEPPKKQQKRAPTPPPPKTPQKKAAAAAASRVETSEATSTASASDATTAEVSSSTSEKEKLEKISQLMKRCLNFFLPPSWSMTKEQVNELDADGILGLEMGTFFTAYERGLKDLVSQHQRAADDSKARLTRLRRLAARLLRSVSTDFNVDHCSDTEQVDLLLEECIRQIETTNNTG